MKFEDSYQSSWSKLMRTINRPKHFICLEEDEGTIRTGLHLDQCYLEKEKMFALKEIIW